MRPRRQGAFLAGSPSRGLRHGAGARSRLNCHNRDQQPTRGRDATSPPTLPSTQGNQVRFASPLAQWLNLVHLRRERMWARAVCPLARGAPPAPWGGSRRRELRDRRVHLGSPGAPGQEACSQCSFLSEHPLCTRHLSISNLRRAVYPARCHLQLQFATSDATARLVP